MSPGQDAWAALLGCLVVLEVLARLPLPLAGHLDGPIGVVVRIATTRVGRFALLLAWGFVGIHLFARHRLVP